MAPHPPQDSPSPLVAFDFDGTLIRGESLSRFLLCYLPWRFRLRGLFWGPLRMLAALCRGKDRHQVKEALLSGFLQGMKLQQLNEIGQAYGAEVLPRWLDPKRLALLREHQAAGHEVWIVSASLEVYLVPLGQVLGLDGVCGCTLEVDAHGYLTGSFADPNCWGREKWRRLSAATRTEGRTLHAYGDSRGDAALLEAAHHGHLLRWRQRKPRHKREGCCAAKRSGRRVRNKE